MDKNIGTTTMKKKIYKVCGKYMETINNKKILK